MCRQISALVSLNFKRNKHKYKIQTNCYSNHPFSHNKETELSHAIKGISPIVDSNLRRTLSTKD